MVLFNFLYFIPISLVIAIVIILITYHVILFSKNKHMKRGVEAKLKSFGEQMGCKYEKLKDKTKAYRYRLETRNTIYYISLISNFRNRDLVITDENTWEFRDFKKVISTPVKSDIMKRLLDMEIEPNNLKEQKKLFIIYPDAKVMIIYKNQFEMEFIYPDVDVYGCNIMAARDLLDLEEL